ncbi:putative short-chain dehydrogenase/reductase SDR, NAD(P)-binding domain superfamily [Septoria linicola]|nr:putative short-chain dehydrogenase/reductase SDR, NAD(P)-binding domain superfamily [Septoria linicola]
MARILITGSAEGLGSLAAKALTERGHEVHLHARSASRAEDAKKNCPKAKSCFIADLSDLQEVKKLADDIKAAGPWDSIIHNAGVMRDVAGKTAPNAKYGLLFATNTLAPYVLTSLVAEHSKRYVFLGSQMHAGGDGLLKNVTSCGYGDSKLHDIMLSFAFARHLTGVDEVNVLDPGWVPTKMGGASAPDDINASVATYVALAEGVGATGQYWGPGATKDRKHQPVAGDVDTQEKLLSELAQISGVRPPGSKL